MMCSSERIRELINKVRQGDESAAATLRACFRTELHWAAIKVGASPVEHIETEIFDQLVWEILQLPTKKKGE